MELLLFCIKKVRLHVHGDDQCLDCEEGNTYRALLSDHGFHFEYPVGSRKFGLPFTLYQIEKHFISAFDEERYSQIYRRATNLRLFDGSGNIVLQIPEATVRMDDEI